MMRKSLKVCFLNKCPIIQTKFKINVLDRFSVTLICYNSIEIIFKLKLSNIKMDSGYFGRREFSELTILPSTAILNHNPGGLFDQPLVLKPTRNSKLTHLFIAL